jgi:curved DNA-binding protein CbpA
MIELGKILTSNASINMGWFFRNSSDISFIFPSTSYLQSNTFMKTLYDVLGVSKLATFAQIEAGYKFCMESLTANEDASMHEDVLIQAKALKEAYAVLSSPSRRQDYDAKLKGREQVSYQVVETAGFPWVSITMICLALIGGGVYYKVRVHQQEVERVALEAAKAKADAEQAANLAAAEQAKLDQQTQLEAANQQRATDQSRREGQQIHDQLQRDTAMANQQVKFESARADQAAQIKARNDLAAWQRALNIPIVRH